MTSPTRGDADVGSSLSVCLSHPPSLPPSPSLSSPTRGDLGVGSQLKEIRPHQRRVLAVLGIWPLMIWVSLRLLLTPSGVPNSDPGAKHACVKFTRRTCCKVTKTAEDAGAAGKPAAPALLSYLLRPMLLGAGLCCHGAGRARAAAGAPACAGPGRAVAGGVRWGVRGACAGGVGARPRRGYVAGFRKGTAAAGIRGGGSRVGGRMLAGR